MTTPTLSIRPANTGDDLPWLLAQLRAFADFYGTHRSLFPADETHATHVLELLITEHVFLIADKGGWRVGFIAGTLMPHFFNPALRELREVFWWVDPAHRGSRAGLVLLDAFTAHGRAHADVVWMSLEHHSPVNDGSLTKRGFVPRESSYLLEVAA